MIDSENMNMQETQENQGDDHSSDSEHFDGNDPSKGSPKKETFSAAFTSFLKQFESQSNLEEKLQLAINFMEESLAQGGSPHFRSFWEARRLCLSLFKENINPTIRAQLWNKYSELSKEARRLKDLLDEQSSFAIEQIEIAVKALEDDIDHFEEQAKHSHLPEGFQFPQILHAKAPVYEDVQKKLIVLNVHASRINALRKELLKTEMRIRQKNKFFQRLSSAGDKVFPVRKELIKQISQEFSSDIERFVSSNFKGEEISQHAPLFTLREEIKALQGVAKVLTLNTNAFTQTRMRLSEAWDHIKVKEKERKKERAQQKADFKQNADEIHEKINQFKKEFDEGSLSNFDANKKLEDISLYMRKTQLDREDVKKLRDELNELRKPIQDKMKAENDAKHHQDEERSRAKKEKFNSIKKEIEKVFNQADLLSEEQIIQKRDEINLHIQESAFSKLEKQDLEKLLKPIKDVISDKKESALLSLSDDARQALVQLQEVAKQRKERRQEIKNQLETLRKAAGSSSLDFEKAIQYNAQINEEKERLDKINQGIEEIEQKIKNLQKKS